MRRMHNLLLFVATILLLFSSCGREKTIEEIWLDELASLDCKGDNYNVAIISKVDCTSCETKLEEFFHDSKFKNNTVFVCEDTREKERIYWENQYPFFKKAKVIYSTELQRYLMKNQAVLTTLQVRNKKNETVELNMTFRELMVNPQKMEKIKGCL